MTARVIDVDFCGWPEGITRGPWSINTWPQGDAEIRIGAVGTPRIATVHLRDASINEQAANAKAIAAVPELIRACALALALVKDTWPMDHGSESVGNAWGALEQSLKKAGAL